MARAALTSSPLAARSARIGTTITMNTPDTSNGNYFVPTGDDVLLLRNTAGAPATLTLAQTDDAYGSSQDSAAWVVTVAASGYAAIGIIPPRGFIQSDGRIYVDASATTLKIGVISLPQ